MATAFSLVATVPYLLNGANLVPKYGSFIEVAALYYGGGLLGGVVVGVAWPLTRWQDGAAVVGALAALPFYLGGIFLLGKVHDPVYLITGIALAGLIGGKVGRDSWEPPTRTE